MTAKEAREILKRRYPGEYIVVQKSCISGVLGDSVTKEVYCESKGWSGDDEHKTYEDAVNALIAKIIEPKLEGEHGTEKP